MIRAGVFIGVDQTGRLQRLTDAAAGARRMYEWAVAQGMVAGSHAWLITDAGGTKVHPDLVYDAIAAIVNGPGVDQLIVYFAGHGVNINRTEHWLLTDAPVKTSAAVNVRGSVDLAYYCGIPHVVFFSDACRVAAEGIQAQNVRGVDVFPNDAASDHAKPVDQFFACCLGRTAAELKDPAVAAGNYTALYTTALLDALKGSRAEVLEPAAEPGDTAQYVKPRKLESYLEAELPRRVKAMGLAQKVNQNPDALITSAGEWLARISTPAGDTRGGPPAAPPPVNLRRIAQTLVRSAAEGDAHALDQDLEQARAAKVTGAKDLAGTAERIAAPFGPDHFESECGIKVRGARVVEVVAPRAGAQLLTPEIVRVNPRELLPVSVLLRFDGNVGTVIPAIPGFVAALTFDDIELVDVAYEPSVTTDRWNLYRNRAAAVRALRAVAASASQHGRFRLDQDDAMKVAQKMQYEKKVDPTLAVYAAYAYRDLEAIGRIQEMSGYLRDDIGATFFDLALLGRMLIGKTIGPGDGVVPFVPLLAQGWALLAAHRVRLHPALDGIDGTLRESLWSLFDAAGLEKLTRAMAMGDVR